MLQRVTLQGVRWRWADFLWSGCKESHINPRCPLGVELSALGVILVVWLQRITHSYKVAAVCEVSAVGEISCKHTLAFLWCVLPPSPCVMIIRYHYYICILSDLFMNGIKYRILNLVTSAINYYLLSITYHLSSCIYYTLFIIYHLPFTIYNPWSIIYYLCLWFIIYYLSSLKINLFIFVFMWE